MEFLGHIISSKGVQPNPSKIESIRQWPVPTSVHNIQVFLGMAGYYNRFIHKYNTKAAVSTDFFKKSNKWQWTKAAQESFEQLKLMLSTAPILQYLWFDLPFVYSTDASGVAIVATLLQNQGQGLLPLCNASRKIYLAEQQYSTEDRQFLAIVFAIVKWSHYLVGGPKWVVCLTDYEPLKYLYTKRDLNTRQSRWIKKDGDINPVIQWVPGKEQIVPDALSRRPDYG